MEKIATLTQALNAAEEIRNKNLDLEHIQELLKHQALAAQVVIYSELEQKDLALSSLKTLEEEKDYPEQILPFLSQNTTPSLIIPSVENYLNLRTSSEAALKDAAVSFIAPYLTQLSPGEKASLMMKVVGEDVETFFSNKELIAPELMKELIKELDLDIKVLDTKTEMAIEYADEPVEVVLHASSNSLEWRLQPQVIEEEKSYWEGIKNTLINFSKNTFGNPTFRKYAIAGVALGVALAAPDAMAGIQEASDFDFEKVKEVFAGLDEQLNSGFMPKFGFQGCEVSVDHVVDSSKHLKTHVNLGDRMMVFDMNLEAHKEIINSKGVKTVKFDEVYQAYVEPLKSRKPGGCDMTSADLKALAKIINNKLITLASK